jgi:uncharacterized membrane protein YeaQ/YmgE (transglycosylase-associated protein family)
MILNVVLWCLFGLVAGTIAQFLMPGKDPGDRPSPLGFVITIVLGIVGAMAGGFVSSRLFGANVASFSLPGLAVAIGGALLLLLLYRVLVAAGYGLSQTSRRR